jgi:hypothetical protein
MWRSIAICMFHSVSTPEIPWSEYLNQKYKYQSLQNHICLKLPVFVVICLKK